MNNSSPTLHSLSTLTVGNGCFWCTEAIFEKAEGVVKVVSGYSGGATENPDYHSVCTGTTGHAECLQITYDNSITTIENLLEIFWATHDPTTLNRQGNDVGTQYRSVVFYNNASEKETAEAYIVQLNTSCVFGKPIVTTLEPLVKFYPAEAYHQHYYENHRAEPYCQLVIRPKLEKFNQYLKKK